MYRNYGNDPRSGVPLESLAVVAQAIVSEREAQGQLAAPSRETQPSSCQKCSGASGNC